MIEKVLEGISGIQCILDDVVITGNTDEEHIRNSEIVWKILSQYGLRASLNKCEYFKENIPFCGHMIDWNGLHVKTQEKIDYIVKAPFHANIFSKVGELLW